MHLLVVEDNKGDIELIYEALQERLAPPIFIHAVTDGVQALAYVRQEEPYSQARRPDLIVLDLSLPRKDGHEVLRELKEDSLLHDIPVIIFAGMYTPAEAQHLLAMGATRVLQKPIDLNAYFAALSDIVHWYHARKKSE
jgi:CheY-like chemotaxis protein